LKEREREREREKKIIATGHIMGFAVVSYPNFNYVYYPSLPEIIVAIPYY
jgi:hypothetical protein